MSNSDCYFLYLKFSLVVKNGDLSRCFPFSDITTIDKSVVSKIRSLVIFAQLLPFKACFGETCTKSFCLTRFSQAKLIRV